MYHGRFKKTYYEAGYHWGELLLKNKKHINEQATFKITNERKVFAKRCLPIYQKYYPDILEEIKGIADGQKMSYEDLYTFLFSMYCFEFNNHCTCLAFSDENNIIFARNSDFLVSLEKLYMNCLYHLEKSYAFNGNTTAFVQMEDGINEHGLAVGLTFIYPKIKKPGLNAGMLVRYILEKCQSTHEALMFLNKVPIASLQTLTIADKNGHVVVVECTPTVVEVINPDVNEKFVITTNNFSSLELKNFCDDIHLDDWRSKERYLVANQALKKLQYHFNIKSARDILSGKYGFMCQYDRKTNADTVWSVIYDIKNKKIYRAEGNPRRKKFIEDSRLKIL